MALYHNSSLGDNGLYVTGTPTYNNFSACCWVRLVSDLNTWAGFLALNNGTNLDNFCLCTQSDGTSLGLGDTVGTSGFGTNLTVGTWYHVGFTRSTAGSNNAAAYLNGVLDVTWHSTDSNNARFCVGCWAVQAGGGGSTTNIEIAHIKVWDGVVLTAAEMAQEMRAATPRRSANLWAWWPMIGSKTLDQSGNGRTLTETATYALVDGPPVGWGAAPLLIGQPIAATGPDYGTPYDHDGVKPWASIWRAARI